MESTSTRTRDMGILAFFSLRSRLSAGYRLSAMAPKSQTSWVIIGCLQANADDTSIDTIQDEQSLAFDTSLFSSEERPCTESNQHGHPEC